MDTHVEVTKCNKVRGLISSIMINNPILLRHRRCHEENGSNASADDISVSDIQDLNKPQLYGVVTSSRVSPPISFGVVVSSRVSPPILLVQHNR